MSNPIPLGRLTPGATGVVVGFEGSAGIRRFVEMGFVPGTRVTALRSAPFGDPVEYAVLNSRVSIRRSDADLVLVEEQP